jgi:hypothetical protein
MALGAGLSKFNMWFAVLLLAILRLTYWVFAFPNADEAYYWWWGQNFSLSYYDHPPLFAWLQGLVAQVLPHDFWSLRFLNIISNGVFFYVYWWLAGYLYPAGQKRAWLLLITAVGGAPLYFVMLTLAWHDHLMITLCLAGGAVLVQYLDDCKYRNLVRDHRLYCGVFLLALAVITKYNALFFSLGIAATIWGDRQLRQLITWQRAIAVLSIFCVVLIPVLLWNLQHDFPSFRYYLTRSVAGGSWVQRLLEPVGFVVISGLMLSPFNCCLLYWGGRAGAWQCLDVKTIYPQLAIRVFLVSSGILLAVSVISTAYYYWNITAYILLFPLIPSAWQKHSIHQMFTGVIIYGVTFALIFVVNYTTFPITALFSTAADPDGRMLYGWYKVGDHIHSIADSADQPLVTTDYRSAAAIAYAMPERRVTALSQRISQFDFQNVDFSQRFILVWDDWHPLTAWHKGQIGRINLDRVKVLPIYQWGVWLKNYYIAEAQALNPLPKLKPNGRTD